jgi:hypothetical protein
MGVRIISKIFFYKECIMTTIGRVYKLTSDGCDKCYVGSTKSPYVSIRMAHHRERHKKKRQNYHGLFNNGDPKLEILEEIEYTKGEDWILRKAEQNWASQNRDNCINRRRCYVSPSVKRKERDERIKKYHESEKGRLALRKATINHRLKQTDKPVTGLKRSQLQDELEKINTRQAELRKEKLSYSSDEEPPVFPPDLHPDQSV